MVRRPRKELRRNISSSASVASSNHRASTVASGSTCDYRASEAGRAPSDSDEHLAEAVEHVDDWTSVSSAKARKSNPQELPTPNSTNGHISAVTAHDLSNSLLSQKAISDKMSVQSLLAPVKYDDENIRPLAGARLTSVYGYDVGLPDLDVPQNKDELALVNRSPRMTDITHLDDMPPALQPGGYYARAVQVVIPGHLKPLPSLLLDNPMNMLYFHHFLSHTSKVLVTSDCPENPFRTQMARLAVRDDNLLSLMLAFAACHRARLLQHPEPVARIALWVRNLFPSFRAALEGDKPISDATLGTAVMLCSLSVSFPAAFEIHSYWDDHLRIARKMVKLRGGPRNLCSSKASFFLRRWFLYLHTFGSVSNCTDDDAQADWYEESVETLNNPEFDCLFGYTNHSHTLLWLVADLVRRADAARASVTPLLTRDIDLREELRDELLHCRHGLRPKVCVHSSISMEQIDSINEALRHGALIHLLRRAFFLPSDARAVQTSVDTVLAAMDRATRRGPLDTPDVIFSLFMAGVEAQREAQRLGVLKYFDDIENAGMKQVVSVRTLLQRTWETRRDWTELSQGVFLG